MQRYPRKRWLLTLFQYQTPPKSVPDSKHLTFIPSFRNRWIAVMPLNPAPITSTSHSTCCALSPGGILVVCSCVSPEVGRESFSTSTSPFRTGTALLSPIFLAYLFVVRLRSRQKVDRTSRKVQSYNRKTNINNFSKTVASRPEAQGYSFMHARHGTINSSSSRIIRSCAILPRYVSSCGARYPVERGTGRETKYSAGGQGHRSAESSVHN